MNSLQVFKDIIREEIQKILYEIVDPRIGAFRRLVITSSKLPTIEPDLTSEIVKLNDRGEFLDVKVTYKKGTIPNTLVVDINGNGATALAKKFEAICSKNDKSAKVIVKNTVTRVPVLPK